MNVPKKSLMSVPAKFVVLGAVFLLMLSFMSYLISGDVLSSMTGDVTSSPICDSGDQETTCTITRPKVLNGAYTFNTLILKRGGSITHDANRDTLENSLKITAKTMTLDAGSSLNVNGKGYAGGTTWSNGFGPGAGKSGTSGSGAGYGGVGGRGSGSSGGEVYDTSVLNPNEAGSGGGGAVSGKKGIGGVGGAGGGLISLDVIG